MPNLFQFADYITNILLWVPQQIFSLICQAVAQIISWIWSICTCDFSQIVLDFSSLPTGVIWFASMFDFTSGMQVIGCAFLLRFFIRRLPFFG